MAHGHLRVRKPKHGFSPLPPQTSHTLIGITGRSAPASSLRYQRQIEQVEYDRQPAGLIESFAKGRSSKGEQFALILYFEPSSPEGREAVTESGEHAADRSKPVW